MHAFTLESPVGLLVAAVTDHGLRRLLTLTAWHSVDDASLAMTAATSPDSRASVAEKALAIAVESQLREYFDGDRHDFELPLDLDRGSDFQRRVWEVIARIPYGEVASYAEVAQAAGAPGAFRAAGSACGHNPVAIVTPCHRVIASGAKLGGYGLGIENKVWLLRHEGIGTTGARPDARVFSLSANGEGVTGRGRVGV